MAVDAQHGVQTGVNMKSGYPPLHGCLFRVQSIELLSELTKFVLQLFQLFGDPLREFLAAAGVGPGLALRLELSLDGVYLPFGEVSEAQSAGQALCICQYFAGQALWVRQQIFPDPEGPRDRQQPGELFLREVRLILDLHPGLVWFFQFGQLFVQFGSPDQLKQVVGCQGLQGESPQPFRITVLHNAWLGH